MVFHYVFLCRPHFKKQIPTDITNFIMGSRKMHLHKFVPQQNRILHPANYTASYTKNDHP